MDSSAEEITSDQSSISKNLDSQSFVNVEKNISILNADKLMLVKVPPAQTQELVFVTLVSDPNDFYIQRYSDQTQLASLEQDLKIYSFPPPNEDPSLVHISIGDFCVTSSSSGRWCRGKVIKVIKHSNQYNNVQKNSVACGKDDVEVFLIDYGKSVIDKVSCLRVLPKKFVHIPPLAFHCSLIDIKPISSSGAWSEKAVQMFAKVVANRPVLMTTIKRESGRRFVDLHKPAPDEIDKDIPVSVRDALVFMHFARFDTKKNFNNDPLHQTDKTDYRGYFKPSTLPARVCVNVVLSHYQSISKFFVQQLGSSAMYLEELSTKIQKFVKQKLKSGFDPASPFSIIKPFINMPCLAKYSYCNMWFRAKIIKVIGDESKVCVKYVDYGNDAVVELEDLLKIPDQFMKLPYQGIECKLSDISPTGGEDEWSKNCKDRFFELVGDQQVEMLVRSFVGNIYNVELFEWTDSGRIAANELSINERLVHEGLASGLTVHKVVKHVKELPILSNGEGILTSLEFQPFEEADSISVSSKLNIPASPSKTSVCVILCISPALFFVQTSDQVRACNKLTNELNKSIQENENQFVKQKWNVEDLCSVYSKTEKRWCRAELKKIITEDTCVVQLFDFGVSETTSLNNLQPLPLQYKSQEPCVLRCYIADIQPAGGKKWTSTAQEIFQQLVVNRKCSMVFCGESGMNADLLPVQLFVSSHDSDDVDVGRELILRGVALPIFRINPSLDDKTSHPLSKIQQEFKKSEAAYQEAENLPKISKASSPSTYVITDDFHQASDNFNFESKIPFSNICDLDDDVRPSLNEASTLKSTFSCVISHIENYNLVYVRKLSEGRILPFDSNYAIKIPLLTDFTRGTPCLAKYDDEQWYRAEVVSKQNDSIRVFYIDWGLTQSIVDKNRLLVLPDQYKTSPGQAIMCLLPSLPSPAEACLSIDQYIALLANIMGEKNFFCRVLDDNENALSVVLHADVNGKTVALTSMLSDALADFDYKHI